MFALTIGWNTYYFESAEAAARVMTLLHGAECIDTLYVEALRGNVHYHKQSSIELKAVQPPDKLFPDYDAAAAFRDECNAPPVEAPEVPVVRLAPTVGPDNGFE